MADLTAMLWMCLPLCRFVLVSYCCPRESTLRAKWLQNVPLSEGEMSVIIPKLEQLI
jgi:hypothetical protein